MESVWLLVVALTDDLAGLFALGERAGFDRLGSGNLVDAQGAGVPSASVH